MSIELLNIDCLEYMKGVPDKYFELAICDPPYGIDVAKMAYTQEDNRPCKQSNGSKLTVKKLKYKHGDWDKVPPAIEYFLELKRVSVNQIIWGWNYFELDWSGGLIKWNKLQPEGVSFGSFEYAFCSLLDREIQFDYLWAGMMQAKSLAEPTTQQGNKSLNEKRIHPTQKPVQLYRWLLHRFAGRNQKILDTHGGSMSIAIACHQMGFDLTLCEIDKDYYDAGVKRFKEQTMQQSLFVNYISI